MQTYIYIWRRIIYDKLYINDNQLDENSTRVKKIHPIIDNQQIVTSHPHGKFS